MIADRDVGDVRILSMAHGKANFISTQFLTTLDGSLDRRRAVATIRRESELIDAEVLELWQAPGTAAKIRDYLNRTLGRDRP